MDAAMIIRDVRRRQGLTQAELARRAGTSQPVISAYEHGRRDPTYQTLRKLVEAGGEQLQTDARPAGTDPVPTADPHEHARYLLEVLTSVEAIPLHAAKVLRWVGRIADDGDPRYNRIAALLTTP